MKTFGSHANCRLGLTLVLRFLPLVFDLAIRDERTRRQETGTARVRLFLVRAPHGGRERTRY